VESNIKKLTESQEDTAFTLHDHYKERIAFHMKMLNYYLNQSQ
jgi:hypothetical protein